MSALALVYCTFPGRADAERIAETVLAERLAGCVNILGGCTAIYRWKDAIERSEEVAALFKTRPELVAPLRERIEALHPYDVPVVESWPVTAGSAATNWIMDETL